MPKSSNSGKVVITQEILNCALEQSPWDLGNNVLYELCKKYPKHSTDEEILAKIWLIGRSYAAAIERRRNPQHATEQFYLEVVVPKIRKSQIDTWLLGISSYTFPGPGNCSDLIGVHKKVTDLFSDISGLEKRSLSSKYLHFHFPNLFYIYDSRAAYGLARVTKGLGKLRPDLKEHDKTYARFFLRCQDLVEQIVEKYQVRLLPRQLDNCLLLVANK